MKNARTPKSRGKARAGPRAAGKRTYGKKVADKVQKPSPKGPGSIVSENPHRT